jgi:hypothetical protein
VSQKNYDLAVKVGEYQDRESGQTKGKYQNIGAIIQKDDGGRFMLLDRFFNPAGIPNPENRPNIIVSLFNVQDRNSGGGNRGSSGNTGSTASRGQTQSRQKPGGSGANDGQPPLTGSNPDGFDDDFPDGIPF